MKRMSYLLIAIFTIVIMTNVDTGYATPAGEGKKEIIEKASRIQIPFIANEGQIQDENVRFYARTFDNFILILTKNILFYRMGSKSWPSISFCKLT